MSRLYWVNLPVLWGECSIWHKVHYNLVPFFVPCNFIPNSLLCRKMFPFSLFRWHPPITVNDFALVFDETLPYKSIWKCLTHRPTLSLLLYNLPDKNFSQTLWKHFFLQKCLEVNNKLYICKSITHYDVIT